MKIIIVFVGILFSIGFFSMDTSAQNIDLKTGFGTIVYGNNGQYYAQSQNSVISVSGAPDTVIKAALDKGGDIYVSGGTYNLSTYFSGFDLKPNTHLKLAPDADIVVPSGYGGYVFRFNSGTAYCVMDGGHVYEGAPVKRSWIGILMQGGKYGV